MLRRSRSRFAPLLLILGLPLLLAGARAGPGRIVVRESPDSVQLRAGSLLVSVERHGARWQIRDRRARVALEEGPGGLFYERDGQVHGLGDVTGVERLPDGARLTVSSDEGQAAALTFRLRSARIVEVAFEPPGPETLEAFGERLLSPPTEAVYGLTERLRDSPSLAPPAVETPLDDIMPPEVGSLDRRGETVTMRVVPTFSLYAPFYQTSRGYGLSVAGTAFGAFDVASSRPDTIAFRFEAGTTPASRRLVFHVIFGPEHRTILDEYTGVLVGRPFVPPDWAFGHWRWRGELAIGEPVVVDGTPINAQVAEDILRYEELGIPPGVYLFDRPVFPGEFGFARWAWDETRLPNPEAMLESLRRRGYRLGLWSSTWTCGAGPADNGTQALARGYLAPGPGGIPACSDLGGSSFLLDPTNPEAFDWWRTKITEFVARYGIQAIKLDRGEEHVPSEAGDVWADGRTGREVRNAYPSLQAALHRQALADAFADGDHVVMTRAGYGDTAREAVFWGGDIPGSEVFGLGPGTDLGLRSAIISQQRAAFLGAPIWGSDTGGYYPFKNREVFARWIEFSTFSGIMEIGGVGSHEPWDMPTEPRFDEEMIEIYVRYTRLRETLRPYIVAAAREASRGMPIVRPMPFESRRDPELRDRWDQYLFGPDLLVAPVWRVGDRAREVYFPRGIWRSYWDHREVHRGPKLAVVEAPLDVIPVYVRRGARVPGADPAPTGRRERRPTDRR